MKLILAVVFFVIFLLLYMVFHSLTEAMVLILPTFYATTGGLILQWLLGHHFRVAVWAGYIPLLGLPVGTPGVLGLHPPASLLRRLAPTDQLPKAHCATA